MQYQYESYINNWKQNLEIDNFADKEISGYVRKYIFEKYENRCAKCGWNKLNIYTNNIPLEIEHIDGNYSNKKEENLILLCPNCHSLTKTYKGANKGHGRTNRKKYYLPR